MLNLARNQSLVSYKMYLGEQEIIDEYGNKTGSFTPSYGELQTEYMCVSPNRGKAQSEVFGKIDEYDRVLTTSNTELALNENSVLWLDGADTSQAHNYIVYRRSPWKNSISFAVKKVDVSNGN